jgi:hypothetical protein
MRDFLKSVLKGRRGTTGADRTPNHPGAAGVRCKSNTVAGSSERLTEKRSGEQCTSIIQGHRAVRRSPHGNSERKGALIIWRDDFLNWDLQVLLQEL